MTTRDKRIVNLVNIALANTLKRNMDVWDEHKDLYHRILNDAESEMTALINQHIKDEGEDQPKKQFFILRGAKYAQTSEVIYTDWGMAIDAARKLRNDYSEYCEVYDTGETLERTRFNAEKKTFNYVFSVDSDSREDDKGVICTIELKPVDVI